MKLEQQVTNLEISKRLRELNVEQESLFYWVERTYEPGLVGNNPCVGLVAGEDINFSRYHRVSDELLASAFTCAELGEILPSSVTESYKPHPGTLAASKGRWKCILSDYKNEYPSATVYADTEADARAKMLIHLIKEGLV